MALYIETDIKFDKTMDNGMVKKVTEHYLVDALSFTEAEARIINEQAPYISGDFTVSAVKKTNLAEIFRDPINSDTRWYRCKVNFITIDERTASEKRKASYILVEAIDFQNALGNLLDGMKGTMADFEIGGIIETAIIEVYDFNGVKTSNTPHESK